MNIHKKPLFVSLSLSLLLLLIFTSNAIYGKAICSPNMCQRTALDATLTFGNSIPAENGIIPSLSADGGQAYLFFGSIFEDNPIRAQLYNNVNGQLVLAQTLGFNATYPVAWSGLASQDFTQFSVLESDDVENMRISILDSNFNVVPGRSRIVTDPAFEFVTGGSFSQDNHYLFFGYAVLAGTSLNTNVFILDATAPGLPTVASTTLSGFDKFDPSPVLFYLTDSSGNKNLFFSFQSSQFSPTGPIPPYFIQAYSVDVNAGTISLVDEMPLPQAAETDVLVRASGREALFALGGFCSLFPTQSPVVYDIITPAIQSALPNDNAEARVLLFDGQTLRLILKQSLTCCNRTVLYPPGDGCSVFLGQNVDIYEVPGDTGTQGPNPQEFWCLADIENGPAGLEFRPQNLPKQDMAGSQVAFSQDGNWFIRTGEYGYLDGVPTVDAYGIHNILLFNVTSAPYQPIC